MKISGIYQITNCITEDFYIGSGSKISKRWTYHKCHLRKGDHFNKHLQGHWNKYGEDNFKFEVIEECLPEKLIEREQYFITELKPTFNKRFIAYSNLGLKFSEETKRKHSEKMKIVVLSESWRKRNKEHLAEIRYLTIPKLKQLDKTYHKSKEFSDKVSIAIKNSENFKSFLKRRNPESLKGRSLLVLQYDKQNNFIMEHPSAKEAVKVTKLSINSFTTILDCCHNRRHSAGGFIWKFKNKEECLSAA